MELILWRHAEAEDAAPDQPDEERELTGKGRKQAARMAKWLDARLPDSSKILVSPARRTVQTAKALDRKFQLHPDLAQGMDAQKILAAAGWPKSRVPVVIVGHQPALGQIASLLIDGTRQDWVIRKGNVFWIARRERDGKEENFIRAVIGADLA